MASNRQNAGVADVGRLGLQPSVTPELPYLNRPSFVYSAFIPSSIAIAGVADGAVPAAAGGPPGAGHKHRQLPQRERADRVLAGTPGARSGLPF